MIQIRHHGESTLDALDVEACRKTTMAPGPSSKSSSFRMVLPAPLFAHDAVQKFELPDRPFILPQNTRNLKIKVIPVRNSAGMECLSFAGALQFSALQHKLP
ncbi:hypothetical protein ABRA89_01080 [Fulvimarina sp. MAC8]